ncbi:MAG: D-3-phosphoglycerate dehydrogenase / 2-oxoglutarate reductase, partial [Acidimicrobiaceae bacterium]
MARVLVTEEIAEGGLDRLREAGHDVDVRLDLSADELLGAVPGAHALIIRSATKVTADVLDAATDLTVVGRAGIGLDNVDVEHATKRGVMVVNAPQSNILSAAEHTMALLLAQARNVPQAHAALVAGRWERSRWEGVELSDKVLGIVGLGRIGKLVAQRASAFGMRLIAYDPFVGQERARQLGVELVELDELMARSDFVTIHVAKTKETLGLVGKELLTKAKPGLRIINVARGG